MTATHAPTPRLTEHARQRCREMGVSTKVAKEIARNPSLLYGGSDRSGNTQVAMSAVHTDVSVVISTEPSGRLVIHTVLWRTADDYVRPEKAARQRVSA